MKFCPECGSDLNGKKICEQCTFNIETFKREVTEPIQDHGPFNVIWPEDTTPKRGMLEDPDFIQNQPIDMFCPMCGAPMINNKTECPKCKYKKKIKKSE